MKQILIVILMLTMLAVVDVCTVQAPPQIKTPDMADPASEHCLDEGGRLEIRDEAGGQVGYCIFEDGSDCEESAFFHDECASGSADFLATYSDEDAGSGSPVVFPLKHGEIILPVALPADDDG